MRRPMRVLAAALGLIFCFAGVGAVRAMTVQPVAVDLRMSGREMSAPVRVENNGPNPLPIEIRIVETEFSPDGVKASDNLSDEVIAFPPQALIPPGQTQVFRLQYVGDPGSERSKHYYAEVAQLPVELPEGQSAIQILYNFQVMVNVASVIGGPSDLSVVSAEAATNADGKNVAAFTIRNSGLNYGYLSRSQIVVTQKDAGGHELLKKTLSANDVQQQIGFGLVGPESTRRFVSPIELESAEGVVEVSLSKPRNR
ncbi:MAG: molecular chaperone [Caulobacteraceae bacterium]|nr:molecular chaperone [Caulobacteraceae bacterium]